MAVAGNPAYPWCPGQSLASPRNTPTPALGWAENLVCLSPPLLWSSAFRVLSGASCQRMSPPQGHERLHVSSSCVGLGTGHASPGIYPAGSCGCKGAGIWCCQLLYSAFQYSFLKCGQHLCPSVHLLCILGGFMM